MSNLSEVNEAKDTFQTLLELSRLLCTGLDQEVLSICIRLCEAGVNPEALATIIKELRLETQRLNQNNDNKT